MTLHNLYLWRHQEQWVLGCSPIIKCPVLLSIVQFSQSYWICTGRIPSAQPLLDPSGSSSSFSLLLVLWRLFLVSYFLELRTSLHFEKVREEFWRYSILGTCVSQLSVTVIKSLRSSTPQKERFGLWAFSLDGFGPVFSWSMTGTHAIGCSYYGGKEAKVRYRKQPGSQ